MQWQPVRGPGDMIRGVNVPHIGYMPPSLDVPNEIGFTIENHLLESLNKWGTAAAQQMWAVEARQRAMRDAQIGGPRYRMGPFKKLPTITHTRPKARPESIMKTVYLPPAQHLPGRG